MEDAIRKISKNGDNKYIFLPKNWGILGKYVRIEILNENELKVTII